MPDPVATMTAMHTLAASLPGYQNTHHDLLIHGGQVYRVTVERIPHQEAQQAFADFIEESSNGNPE